MNNEVESSQTGPPIERRGLLKSMVTSILAGAVGVIPLVPGLAFFLDPLIRKGEGGKTGGGAKKDADGYIRMDIGFSALPEDGTPQQYTVYDDKQDAWNLFRAVPIGSVWLRRIGQQVIAFNTVCPHLGCAVGHRPSEGDFFCPCHTSAFDLDGKKLNEVPPRDLDVLDVRRKSGGSEAVDGDEIWIQFQNDRAATSEKVPV
ncbi:MAG: ubiquinol-cytochrome c reductase iron-sulfur subunit [Planctomycetaceae bacterium]